MWFLYGTFTLNCTACWRRTIMWLHDSWVLLHAAAAAALCSISGCSRTFPPVWMISSDLFTTTFPRSTSRGHRKETALLLGYHRFSYSEKKNNNSSQKTAPAATLNLGLRHYSAVPLCYQPSKWLEAAHFWCGWTSEERLGEATRPPPSEAAVLMGSPLIVKQQCFCFS